MAWIKIGADSNDFTFEIPTDGTSDWGQGIRTLFLNKLRDHDHSGTGRGAKLGAGSIEDRAIAAAKLYLNDDTWVQGSASGTPVNLFRFYANTLEIDKPIKFTNGVQLTPESGTGLYISSLDVRFNNANLVAIEQGLLTTNSFQISAKVDFPVIDPEEGTLFVYVGSDEPKGLYLFIDGSWEKV